MIQKPRRHFCKAVSTGIISTCFSHSSMARSDTRPFRATPNCGGDHYAVDAAKLCYEKWSDKTFSNFIVGKGNRAAHTKAVDIANGKHSDGTVFVITGDVGVGKSHLMHAIGNKIRDTNPGGCRRIIHAEDLIEEVTANYLNGSLNAFRQRYERLDALLIDDITLLFREGREQAQRELLRVVATLCSRVVLTSYDRSEENSIALKAIAGVVPHLLIEWVDTTTIDKEFRRRLIVANAASDGVVLDDAVVDVLSQQSIPNIRELEGLLKKLIATSRFYDVRLTANLAEVEISCFNAYRLKFGGQFV